MSFGRIGKPLVQNHKHMKRYHLIEIHEQTWCPAMIRDAVTDYLQYVIKIGNAYQPIFQKLTGALKSVNSRKVVDLCSGGGGPWIGFKKELSAELPQSEVVLTDLYPNLDAFQKLKSDNGLEFSAESVNVLDVPENLKGFRTMFSSFHHFQPEQARGILRDAVGKDCGIGIFEATPRNIKPLILMLLTPLIALFLTPGIRPFRWSRIIFTYLIPIIPLVICFDGIVSVLRTYTPDELLQMASDADRENYVWEAGEEKSPKTPVPVVYLIGYPKPEN